MATSTIPNLNLSFDTTPTSGSTKPVTSNGIYGAIEQATADEAKSYNMSGTTWADAYAALSKLNGYIPACCSLSSQLTSLLTGGKIALASTGIVKNVNPSAGVYEFMTMSNLSQNIYTWRITGLTSASVTPTVGDVAIYRSSVSAPLTSSNNLDSVVETGNYYATTGSMPQNSPVNSNFGMYVNRRNDLPVQVIISNNGEMLYRFKFSSGWQKWRLVTATIVS